MPDAATTSAGLDAAIRSVTAAREAGLASMPMPRILTAIDRAVARWLDPSYALRRQAQRDLPGLTGYSPAMVREGLPLLFEPFRRHGLEAMLHTEFGRLDAPAGPRLITHILAGNIPSIGPESIIRALLLRSASVVKPSSGDTLTPALFAESLHEADAAVGACIAVLPWAGGRESLERQAFAASNTVIAYGGEEALERLRKVVPPTVSFIEHGHRISFAAITQNVVQLPGLAALAQQAAWDVSLFDQQGCVSPHAIFVERGGQATPRQFAQALADAMAALESRLPRGKVSTEEAASIQQIRGTWQLREAAGQPAHLLLSRDSTAWTVLYEEDAPLEPTCLNRTVRVIAVDSLDLLAQATASYRPYLQTAGVAAPDRRLAQLRPVLEASGVTRICELGRMQHPPADWLHDGRHPLRELAA